MPSSKRLRLYTVEEFMLNLTRVPNGPLGFLLTTLYIRLAAINAISRYT